MTKLDDVPLSDAEKATISEAIEWTFGPNKKKYEKFARDLMAKYKLGYRQVKDSPNAWEIDGVDPLAP